jgi:succinoglycan biosynthesis transport protein ExoP
MEAHTPQIEYLHYAWLVVRKRKWMILGVGLATFAIVQFFGYLVTPIWEGTTLVLVERTSMQNVSVFREVDMPVTGAAGDNPAAELVPLLTGSNMAYDVVREFHLDDLTRKKRMDPPTMRDVIKGAIVDALYSPLYLIRGWQEPNWTDKAADEFVEDWVDVKEEEERTGVINITVNGESPQLAADVANGMVTFLEQRTEQFSRAKAAQSYPVVSRQVAEAEANLKRSEEALVRFQEAAGVYGPEESRRLLVEKLDQLRTDLESTRRRQGELASSMVAGQANNQFLQANIDLNPVIGQIQGALVTLNARRSALLLEKTPDHPDVKVVDAEIEKNRRQLTEALAVENSMLNVRTGELGKSIQDVQSQIFAMPKKETELARLQQLVTINRQVFETAKSRLEQVAMDQQSTNNEYTIRVLDRAYVPPGRGQDWPVWPLNILAGILLGLMFGVGGAFGLEYWNRPVLAARDVEQVLGLRFLGRFPELEQGDS